LAARDWGGGGLGKGSNGRSKRPGADSKPKKHGSEGPSPKKGSKRTDSYAAYPRTK